MIRYTALLASAARTVTGNSADVTADDSSPLGAGQFVIDVTAFAGTAPTLVVTIQGLDPASGKYFTLLASAVINTVSTVVLRIGPGFPATANLSVNDLLPKQYRVLYTITGSAGQSFTFSVGASTA